MPSTLIQPTMVTIRNGNSKSSSAGAGSPSTAASAATNNNVSSTASSSLNRLNNRNMLMKKKSNIIITTPNGDDEDLIELTNNHHHNNKNNDGDDLGIDNECCDSSLFLNDELVVLNGNGNTHIIEEIIDDSLIQNSTTNLKYPNNNGNTNTKRKNYISSNGQVNRSESTKSINHQQCAITIPQSSTTVTVTPCPLYGSGSNLTATTLSTTDDCNGVRNRKRKSKFKLLFCSWVLTFLVLLIIIGISFASGLFAAKYFNKYLCDSSSASSTSASSIAKNSHQFTNSRLSPSLFNSQNRDGRNNKFGKQSISDIKNSNSSVIYDNSDKVIDKMFNIPFNNTTNQTATSITPILTTTTTTTKSVPVTQDHRFIGKSEILEPETVNEELDEKEISTTAKSTVTTTSTTTTTTATPTTTAATTSTTTSTPATTTTTTTAAPTTQAATSTTPLPAIVTQANTKETPTTTVEPNILSTLINQYNEMVNETMKPTRNDSDLSAMFFPVAETPTEMESSNQTEIKAEMEDVETSTTSTSVPQTTTEAAITEVTIGSDQVTTKEQVSNLANQNVTVPKMEETVAEVTTSEIPVNTTRNMSIDSPSQAESPVVEVSTEFSNSTTSINLTNNSTRIESSCLETEFHCPQSDNFTLKSSLECFDKSRICDGIIDCPNDGFDELNCEEKDCEMNFQCGSITNENNAIITTTTSDSIADLTMAVNTSTASTISTTTTAATVPPTDFPLANQTIDPANQRRRRSIKGSGQCIPRTHYCDGIWDCADGSDESGCLGSVKCEPGKVACRDNSACISGKQACDGIYNCRDRSDEAGCGTKSSCETMGKFYCDRSALCISRSLVCDGHSDCEDGADEKDCITAETCNLEGQKFFCPQSRECIDTWKRCDGRPDCLDYSDEDRCFESDSDNYVYVYNGHQNHWSLLCVDTQFNQEQANEICTKLGMAYATNFTKVPISRMMNGSTWALINPPLINVLFVDANDVLMQVGGIGSSKSILGPRGWTQSYSLSFRHTCDDNLALRVECEPRNTCDESQRGPLDSPPEEVPTPIYITNDSNKNKLNSTECLAYALSSRWLLTSGQCLLNMQSDVGEMIVNVGDNETILIDEIRIHPKYTIFNTIRFPDFDMALVATKRSIPKSILNHSTICLPESKLDPEITCFIGGHRNGDTAFKVIEFQQCNSTQHFAGSLTERHFCAVKDDRQCLSPPNLPLICLSSHSHWYVSGFSTYQRGCDPITGQTKFLGYKTHPTLFSNLFTMKAFIDQTLGSGTYGKERTRIGSNRMDMETPLSGTNPEKVDSRAWFVVTGSEEERLLIEREQSEKARKEQEISNSTETNQNSPTIRSDLNDKISKIVTFSTQPSNQTGDVMNVIGGDNSTDADPESPSSETSSIETTTMMNSETVSTVDDDSLKKSFWNTTVGSNSSKTETTTNIDLVKLENSDESSSPTAETTTTIETDLTNSTDKTDISEIADISTTGTTYVPSSTESVNIEKIEEETIQV